jgi:hypothetical protein
MSNKTIIDELIEHNANALLFEPREHLDKAIIGYTTGPSTRPCVAIYDRDLLCAALADSFLNGTPDATDEEKKQYQESGVLDQDVEEELDDQVEEWMGYNTEGSDMGTDNPIVVQTCTPPANLHRDGDFF